MTPPPDTGFADPRTYKSAVRPVWCPGCGDHAVLSGLMRALSVLGRPPEEIVIVSGIGCSSRLPAYTAAYGIHGVHGRALTVAAGVKLARPELEVIVVGGDGDGYSIGGNHFLHACRRNVDLTYLVMDNRVYGMTKGQPSPTTEPDWNSAMAPGGTGVSPFNPLVVAIASGANFAARGYSGDPNGLARLIVEAIRSPGFSFVEVLSPCVTFRPEQRGWKERIRQGPAEPLPDTAAAAAELLQDDGFGIGVFYQGDRAAYRPARRASTALAEIEHEFVP